MRLPKRTHGVNVAWSAEQFARPDVNLVYERSVRMSADIFTKAFSDPLKWKAVCELILVLDESRLSNAEFLTSLLATPPSLSGGYPNGQSPCRMLQLLQMTCPPKLDGIS